MFIDYQRSALSAGDQERIRARVPARSSGAIDQAGTFEWLPAEHHLAWVEATAAVLGARQAEDHWRRMTAASFEKPIFRPIIQGARALFGSDPVTLAKVLPRGWSLVGTDCGSFAVEHERGSKGQVHWVDIPPQLSACKPFVAAWRGALGAFIDVFGMTGEVGVVDTRLADARTITFNLRWM